MMFANLSRARCLRSDRCVARRAVPRAAAPARPGAAQAARAARAARAGAITIAIAIAAVMLAACGSAAPPRFHTLLAPAAGAPLPANAALPAWQLLPVSIPAQVDLPQFVVRTADDTLAVLEHERWIAPLNEEIRAALIEQLSATLGSPGNLPASGRKDWRITVDVQRFDSAPGRATLVAQWALLGDGVAALRCRSAHEQAVRLGMAALAAGHRQTLERLGSSIALGLAALHAGQPAGCPAATQ